MEPEELLLGADGVAPSVPIRKRKAKRTLGRNRGRKLVTPELAEESDSNNDDSDTDVVSIKPEAVDLINPFTTTMKPKLYKKALVMVIAVDFGMTHSALSFCLETANPENVVCQKVFPGFDGMSSKVPTLIAYKDEIIGHMAFEDNDSPESVFGFQVTMDMKSHAFSKLALIDDETSQEFEDPEIRSSDSKVTLRTSKGAKGLRVVVDCLSHLRQIVFRRIEKEHGSQLFESARLRIVITHPAAFSDRARDKLYQAAVDSGFRRRSGDEIRLASESESAAMAACVFHNMTRASAEWEDVFEEQSIVSVLDIGGLTCDATTFRVKDTDPLVVTQTCPPQGGNCGTVGLQCRLHKHLSIVLGKEFEELPKEVVGYGSNLWKDFEKELRGFGEEPLRLDKVRRFRLPMRNVTQSDYYDEVSGRVLLTGHELKCIIDPGIEYMKSLITDQVVSHNAESEDRISTVVLCGGGSNFPYVFSALSAHYQSLSATRLKVIQTRDPMAAAVEGANMSALKERTLINQKSRAAYGVGWHRKLEPGDVWNPKDIFQCSYGGRRVRGFVEWHMKKGDVFDLTKPGTVATVGGYTMLNVEDLDSHKEHKVTIFSYSGKDKNPPDRQEHPDVSPLGYIPVNLADMSKSAKNNVRKAAVDSGSLKLPMSIVQCIGNGRLEFEARIGRTKVGRYGLNSFATNAA